MDKILLVLVFIWGGIYICEFDMRKYIRLGIFGLLVALIALL